MARTMKSCVRAAGSGLALAAAAALPIAAAAQQQPAAAPVDTSAAQVVVRDSATGQLRAATAAEVKAMHATSRAQRGAQASTSPRTVMQRVHWTGARGARVTDDFATYSVLVKQPDGSLKEICVEGRSAAEAALKAPQVAATQQLPTE